MATARPETGGGWAKESCKWRAMAGRGARWSLLRIVQRERLVAYEEVVRRAFLFARTLVVAMPSLILSSLPPPLLRSLHCLPFLPALTCRPASAPSTPRRAP